MLWSMHKQTKILAAPLQPPAFKHIFWLAFADFRHGLNMR